MLSLLILFAAAPQSMIPVLPPGAPPSAWERSGAADMPVFGGSPPFGCPSEATNVNEPISPDRDLTWREGDQPVGHYLLLERRIDGCPAPIVVNHRVPGSNAIGRERGPAPGLPGSPRD